MSFVNKRTKAAADSDKVRALILAWMKANPGAVRPREVYEGIKDDFKKIHRTLQCIDIWMKMLDMTKAGILNASGRWFEVVAERRKTG